MTTTAEATINVEGHGTLPCTVVMGGTCEMEHPITGGKWTAQADKNQVISATFVVGGKPITVSMSPNYVEIVDGVLVSTMFLCERWLTWQPNTFGGLKNEIVTVVLGDDGVWCVVV